MCFKLIILFLKFKLGYYMVFINFLVLLFFFRERMEKFKKDVKRNISKDIKNKRRKDD